jgi:hypothetical protein
VAEVGDHEYLCCTNYGKLFPCLRECSAGFSGTTLLYGHVHLSKKYSFLKCVNSKNTLIEV